MLTSCGFKLVTLQRRNLGEQAVQWVSGKTVTEAQKGKTQVTEGTRQLHALTVGKGIKGFFCGPPRAQARHFRSVLFPA